MLDEHATGLKLSPKKTLVAMLEGNEQPLVRQGARMKRIQSAVSGGFDAVAGEESRDALLGAMGDTASEVRFDAALSLVRAAARGCPELMAPTVAPLRKRSATPTAMSAVCGGGVGANRHRRGIGSAVAVPAHCPVVSAYGQSAAVLAMAELKGPVADAPGARNEGETPSLHRHVPCRQPTWASKVGWPSSRAAGLAAMRPATVAPRRSSLPAPVLR